jgi:hypothetical protein
MSYWVYLTIANNWGDYTTQDTITIIGQEARIFDQFIKEVFIHAILYN